MSSEQIAMGREIGAELGRILGIDRVVDVDLSFHLEEVARAHVTFLVNQMQAEAIVELLETTKWGQNHV